jgi:uncharacterized protein with FMN-binding domain
MARNTSNKKVANSLVVMSSAAVLAVYSAGYVRTKPAAGRIEAQAIERTLTRQTPSDEGAPDAAAVAPSPAVSVHSNPKPDTQAYSAAVTPKVTASSAPVNAKVPVPNAESSPVTAETPSPSPVADPAPVTSVASVPAVTSFTAQPAEVPAAAPTAPAPNVWKDGKYVAWGGSRHGDIEATVVIEGGRIASAEISNCQTRYPCDVIEKLPPQVIKRQSPNVDRIGGATESADAFYSAVFFALKLAK